MSGATITIQPGSIKHKVLEAILDLEEAATGAAIRKRHPSNEHLVNIAIDQLTSDALIEITSEGNYALTAAAQKAIKGQSITGAIVAIAQQRQANADAPVPPKPPEPKPVPRVQPKPPRQGAERVAPTEKPAAKSFVSPPSQPPAPSIPSPAPVMAPVQRSEEPTVASLIKCNECNRSKPKDEYYIVNGEPLKKCKRCVLDRQKAAKEARDKKPAPNAKRAAKSAGAVRSQPALGDLVIPAAGEIRCRATGLAYEIAQGESRVMASLEQLQAIRDWATAQLKARS